MKNSLICWVLPALLESVLADLDYLKGFDDSILYKINWPGAEGLDNIDQLYGGETMVVTTNRKEKYRCVLPSIQEKEKENYDEYTGPNPVQLLAPMFALSTCTTLLEPYWSYELCHGRYIRQYHEEREGKKLKLQEYTLGKWDGMKTKIMSAELDKLKEEGSFVNPPIKKLEGINLPYLQLNYTDGTICDLNGKPRRTSVLYVCFMGGKNDIFIIKETSTCEYEAIVTSSELCKHPKYRPQLTGENDISCSPLDGAPAKPVSMMMLEGEAAKQKQFSAFGDAKSDKMFAVYSIGEYKDKDGKMQFRVEFRSLDGDEVESEITSDASESPSGSGPPATSPVKTPANAPPPPADIPFNAYEFLEGRACPEGGYGWWRYRFCYNGKVEQYHYNKEKGTRDSVTLGLWDKQAHLDWLEKHPHKRPRPVYHRTHISYFYGDGDICPETGKPRETEVKLKCSQSRGTVSLYLLEPSICQYILGVESSIICEIINKVDDDGLYLP
uniref:Endoplasmic reticulum lectin 1 n=1 Tax=Lygus hesperus TaxID=30085 RepID=A0A0A9X029_LYGHE